MVLEKSAQNSGKGDNTPVRTERCIVLKRHIVSLFRSVFCSPFLVKMSRLSGASTRAKQWLIVASIVVFVFVQKILSCSLQCQCVWQLA